VSGCEGFARVLAEAGEDPPGPDDPWRPLREAEAELARLNAARRAWCQRHAADRQRALEASQKANAEADITGSITAPWMLDEPPPVRFW
jgi:hypothetical protein